MRAHQVDLTAKEFALIEFLMRRAAGTVVSRGDIAEHVWDEHYDPLSNVVDVCIQRLRLTSWIDRECRRSFERGEAKGISSRWSPAFHEHAFARSRLTLWYAIVLVVMLCLFGADIVWLLGGLGVQRIDRELADAEATVIKIVGNELKEQEPPSRRRCGGCRDRRGPGPRRCDPRRSRRPSGVQDPWPPDSPTCCRPTLNAIASTVQTASGEWRVRSRPEHIDGTNLVVLVAMPLTDVRREQREVKQAMVIGIPIMLLLAGAGGWWLASIGLAPITRMAARAVRLPLTGSEDLGEPTRRDELGQLTGAFNGLVARLRAALQTQRQFMADASHELRTPVSIIRSAAEVALSRKPRDEEDYRETLTIASDQTRRLTRLIDDMLVLARADAGGYPVHAVDLDLAEVVDDCRRAVKVLATERGVQIRLSAGREVPFAETRTCCGGWW